MDQRVLGGVGNIYASEMLFRAGIRPRRRAAPLTPRRARRASPPPCARVLERAVELGGSSISDYRDANGSAGYFQIHHAVYDRAGQPCRTLRRRRSDASCRAAQQLLLPALPAVGD